MRQINFFQYRNGHKMGCDCWCEPMIDHYFDTTTDVVLKAIIHEDYTPHTRKRVLYERDKSNDWVTQLLNSVTEVSSE